MTEVRVMLTEEQGAFVSGLVEDGYFPDAGEVLRQALVRMKQEDDEKLVALRAAIDEGEESGVFEGDAFASVRMELGWSVRLRCPVFGCPEKLAQTRIRLRSTREYVG